MAGERNDDERLATLTLSRGDHNGSSPGHVHLVGIEQGRRGPRTDVSMVWVVATSGSGLAGCRSGADGARGPLDGHDRVAPNVDRRARTDRSELRKATDTPATELDGGPAVSLVGIEVDSWRKPQRCARWAARAEIVACPG